MYDDIINVNYPIKLKHQRMNRCDRASQFMPFAALTGYAQSINEAGRLVDKKQELKQILLKTKETLKYVKSQAYYDKLIGTIGKDDLYKG